MATSNGAAIARQVRLVLEAGPIRDLSDGQLLDQFNAGRPNRRELAFATLVERHGPMVRVVARGILGSRADADDAFQATFLILARKAADLSGRDTVGPWLFQVARRTSLASRRAEARRRRLDQTVDPPPTAYAPDPELAGIVHEEVARLPDRDRAVVILCDLEGESLDQAARILGCPVGTVKSRLSRARDRLRRGLQRRGLDGSQLIPLGLAPALPTSFVDLATTAAIRFAAWSPLATSVAAILARGVIRTMTWNRCLHSTATALGMTLAVSIGSAWLAAGEAPADPPRAQSPPPEKPARPGVATFNVIPDLSPESVSARVNAVPPPGIDVNVELVFPTKVLSVSPPGLKVRKGDTLFRLDPAPITEGIGEIETYIRSLQAEVQASEIRSAAEQTKLEAAVKQVDAKYRETEAQQIRAEQELVDRAEARVKRYRDASELAGRLTIDPTDPKLLPALVARMDLLDRLDSAETELGQKRKQFEQARRTIQKAQKPASPEVEEQSKTACNASEEVRVKREKLEAAVGRKQRAEESLQHCTITSPADGIVANDGFGPQIFQRPQRVPTPFKVNPGIGNVVQGSGVICRVLTSEHADQEILLDLNQSTPLRFLKPNDTVLFKAITDGSNRVSDKPVLLGKFVELTVIMINENMGQKAARFRFDTPIDLSPARSAEIEYRVELPTGQVRIPARALAGDRVAVEQPDGQFQWRAVDVLKRTVRSPDDEVIIRKLLAVGETIALDPWAAMGETPAEPRKVDAAGRPIGIKTP